MTDTGFVKKTDIVREAVASGNMKKALSIAKGFRMGITKEQHDDMTRAHECMGTSAEFYRSIGFDVDECVRKGIEVLVSLYG